MQKLQTIIWVAFWGTCGAIIGVYLAVIVIECWLIPKGVPADQPEWVLDESIDWSGWQCLQDCPPAINLQDNYLTPKIEGTRQNGQTTYSD